MAKSAVRRSDPADPHSFSFTTSVLGHVSRLRVLNYTFFHIELHDDSILCFVVILQLFSEYGFVDFCFVLFSLFVTPRGFEKTT